MADKKKPKINKGSLIVDRGTEDLQKKVKKLESRFVNGVIDELKKVDTTKDNNINPTKKNRQLISEMRGRVMKVLKKIGYFNTLNNYLANFDELEEFNQQIHKAENDITLKKSFLNPFKKFAVDKVVFDLQGQGLATSLIKPIQDQLTQNVNLGGNLIDMVRGVEGQLASTGEKMGLFRSTVFQASRDALGQYDGMINQKVKDAFGLDAFRYVGSLVKDSREQCRRWVEMKILLDSELAAEIQWAFNNGSGMIKGTNTTNFAEFRGGHNCGHTAIPVRSKK